MSEVGTESIVHTKVERAAIRTSEREPVVPKI